MKFLIPTSGIAIICFVVTLQNVTGFTPTDTTSSMTNTIGHRRQICHRHFSTTDDFSTQTSSSSSSSSSSTDKGQRVGIVLDNFFDEFWRSEIDDTNLPPSHSIIRQSIGRLASGSELRTICSSPNDRKYGITSSIDWSIHNTFCNSISVTL